MTTPSLLKKTVSWNKDYYVTIPVDDVTNKILLRESNYIVDVFMWPKFGNCSISMREVITTTILYKDLTRKTAFFERWSWFKFNNLGLALGTKLNFTPVLQKGENKKSESFGG